MKKEAIVLLGMHASGKTTAGKFLESRGFSFFPEIGELIRRQVDFDFLTSIEWFDKEVMDRELTRDQEVLNSPQPPAIETWHIGNIAYAAIRSPRIAEIYFGELQRQIDSIEPRCLLFQISEETFRTRSKEPVISGTEDDRLRFFLQVQANLLHILSDLNLGYTIIDGNQSQQLMFAQIKHVISDGIIITRKPPADA